MLVKSLIIPSVQMMTFTERLLTAWSNVMLHVVEAVGENLPLGETELD